ncbi:hypothetical protein [Massilia horti]|uniref:Uncharacterized protein n=1 Tax=Massilia horti TaxID=2562153 RepID=A0A4Y9SRI4_9BURK|nr:hypothetical protein [Massilia horti]TFW27949.1 hypothetical protein E4O92_22550 [Massilia horti]
MKKMIIGLALAAAAFPVLAQSNVSISVGQPGFYGRLDIGGYGPPPVVYTQPVIVQQPARYYEAAPVYLRVPEGHRKHWSRWCGHYGACGQRVLFVRDDWYVNTYVPRYREQHYRVVERPVYRDRDDYGRGRDDHGRGRGHGEGHGHGHGRHD